MQSGVEGTRRSISASGLASLIAVCAVVATVSFPLLRRIGMAENGSDALRTVELFGARLESVAETGAAPERIAELSDVAGGSRRLERELADGEWLDGGKVFRRHGYDFELGRDAAGAALIRARPWTVGETGERAYAYVAGRGTFVTEAHAAELASGAPTGWKPIE